MRYISTRCASDPLGFHDAFAAGLAPDGGLYVPETLPKLPGEFIHGTPESYISLAYDFLKHFDTDHETGALRDLVERSYATFDAPLKKLGDHLFVLELFHGPTLAFKDFGLQLVGNLFEDQIRRTGNPINVLGATSGDTGAAAINGLANKKGVNVFILYPDGRISALQERQMTCTGAANIFPIPIEGSFDDAQAIVKSLFGDLEFKKDAALSAVNSINLARVLAQCVYYFHAYQQLPEANREKLQIVVPTGNFGNIFAGWLAGQMGLPVDRFGIATNRNDILYRLFNTGAYEPGDVHASLAPSMDIQIASNFERFLFYQFNGDGARVAAMMKQVKEGGAVTIPNFNPDRFFATRSSDEDIATTIRRVHERYNYVVDPHTACGFQEIDESRNTIVLSTAHPAKFPETIEKAIGTSPAHPSLEALKQREQIRHPLPANPDAVKNFILANRAN